MTSSHDPGPEHALLEAIAFGTGRLLPGIEPPPFAEVLEALGRAARMARVCLVAARGGIDGEAPRMEGRHQWTAPGVARLAPGPEGWQRYPRRWSEELARGTTLAGPTRTFPDPERASLEAAGARSALLVPVTAGDEWYGQIECHDTWAERPWAPHEIEAVSALAGIVGTAIAHRRVLAALDRRTSLLRTLGTVTSLLAETGNWRQALPRALDGLRTATRCRGAWAYGPDPGEPGHRAVLLYEVVAPGTRPGGGRARVLDLPAGAAGRLQTAWCIHDSMDPGDRDPFEALLSSAGVMGWAIAPMILDAGSVGFVGLDADRPRAWAEGELEALDIVATALKAAIRRGAPAHVPMGPDPRHQPAGIPIARRAEVPAEPEMRMTTDSRGSVE